MGKGVGALGMIPGVVELEMQHRVRNADVHVGRCEG